MSSDLSIIFYTKKHPKEYYKDLIKRVAVEGEEWYIRYYYPEVLCHNKDDYVIPVQYEFYSERVRRCVLEDIEEIPERCESIGIWGYMPGGSLHVLFNPTILFNEPYYEVSSLHEYGIFCSYHYDDDWRDEPTEEAVKAAAKVTRQLIDMIRKVIAVTQPDFGYGDVDGRVDEYISKLYNKTYPNLREYLADITNNFTTLPWLFVYKDNLNIKIPDKVIWDEIIDYKPAKPKIIEKIGECWLYILKDTSVSATW